MNGPEDAADSGLDGGGNGGDAGEILDDAPADSTDDDGLGFDIGKSVDSISKDLNLGQKQGRTDDGKFTPPGGQAPAPAAAPAVEALAPPRSWAADKHELWKQLPRPAQEYYNQREEQFLKGLDQYKGDAGFAKTMREIVTPYVPALRAQGISETDAFKFLLNANHRLTQGTPESRRAAYEKIGRDLGLVEGIQTGEQQPVDPVVKQLQTDLGQIKSVLSAEQRTRHEQVRAKADTDVQAFAADKANLYFGEVSKDMVGFIHQGFDLPTAYEKAVWGNPVTRAKEIARIQTEAAAKKGSPEQVEAAKRATSVNTRGNETHRAPTEHKGKFLSDESLKEDLRKIRARTN